MAAQPHEQTQQGQEAPKACGYCRNCHLQVDDGIVFCEPFCEKQWIAEHPVEKA